MSSSGVVLSQIRNEAALSPGYCNSRYGDAVSESIMIYLAVSGSMIPMRVLESDSIESVKLRIQTCKGFVVKNQKLVCGGRVLSRNNSLVRDYGVANGNVLHLVLRLSDLQVISVKTTCGKEFTFHVERSRDVGYVKQKIAKQGNNLADLEGQEVIYNGERLEDQRLIDDICKHNNAVIHLLVRKPAKVRPKPVDKNFEISIVASQSNDERNDDIVDRDQGWRTCTEKHPVVLRKTLDKGFWLKPVVVNPKVEFSSVIRNLVDSTFDGLDKGNQPMRSSEGTGGAYFIPDSSGNKYVSVFKPMDEEPLAINNPQGLPLSQCGEGLKKGTRVGEGALREVAAYILDHPICGRRSLFGMENGFAGVPPTTLVQCLHKGFHHPKTITPKIGSLQMFMENNGSCEDMGPGAFPVKEVHKISVLDMRLANADRHAGNILFSNGRDDGRAVLIPIDHGYCLPASFEDCTFDWLYWPQVKQPYSSETINYIMSLDAEEDIAILKFYGWALPPDCARVLRISTMLLKKGVERGLTPYTIGSIMCRENLTKESVIEEIVQEAQDSVLPGASEALFLECLSQVMDRRLDEFAVKK